MTGVSGDKNDRMNMWRVLAAWVGARSQCDSSNPLLDSYLTPFQAIAPMDIRQRLQPAGIPLSLIHWDQWLVGPSLSNGSEPVVPIATVQLDGGDGGGGAKELATRGTIRLSLLQARVDNSVHATGWRFEMAETDHEDASGAIVHPYQHAQAIRGWTIGSRCLIHPHTQHPQDCDGVDPAADPLRKERLSAERLVMESHPAFPLRSTSLTGLAASFVATLHGAVKAAEWLGSDQKLRRLGGDPGADLQHLFGWQAAAN